MRTIGIDVGGTFTDLVLCDTTTGMVAIHKVSTTPSDPADGVMRGILDVCRAHDVPVGSIAYVMHGTTTATNAVLEDKGARTGLVTNEGFRDILHIARHQRVEHYSIMQQLPWQNRPLIKRRYRKVVKGRLTPPNGVELEPLDEDAVRRAGDELAAEGIESVAVCFLFSYLNPDHEERAREILARRLPNAFISTSCSVAPQFREFERFTTAALSAFIGPKISGYIQHLETALRGAGLSAELRIMASNGGVATPAMAIEKPALTLLSGLAAGVLGGAWIGQSAQRQKLITFDIGGTSADIGIVVDGRFAETDARSASIAGFPLLLPMIDVHTIGAGGGSIAHVDHGGAFRVGPRSAGAVPGPAAYGHGGTEPTVTDANVVLGRLDPQDFLGGAMKLDPDAANRAVGALAQRLGMGLAETAEGVLTVINSNMANAIRSRTVQKGIDPRQFSLIAFGGAGPLHGADVAAMLGIAEVIVPQYPGITSAMGLLTTDLKYDAIRTQFQVSTALDLARLNGDLRAMELALRERFHADRMDDAQIAFTRRADLRYVGQGYELQVALPDGEIAVADLAEVWRAFHALHRNEYGQSFDASTIEIVNVRVIGTGHLEKIGNLASPRGGTLDGAKVKVAPCLFRHGRKLASFETGFYRRKLLPAGVCIPSPAIILQVDSTTVIPPGTRAITDAAGNIVITLGHAS